MSSGQSAPTMPLSGVRVLDMGRLFAAPWAGQLLGDLGAEIIKVERSGQGDEIRMYGPPFLEDRDGNPLLESTYSLSANRNKRSLTADLSKPEGRALVRELAMHCDVLIENFKVGDLARYGLDHAALSQVHPGLIYCSITGFGQSGPRAKSPATDAIFQAMSGMMTITGEPDGEPQRVGFVAIDLLTGVYASTAILAALRHREINGGTGQHIDLALLDVAMAAMSHRATEYLLTGVSPMRKGSGSAGNVPARTFLCSSGSICVQAGGDIPYRRLCNALGHPELADDARFATRAARVANEPLLNEILDAIFRERTVQQWYELLAAHDVFCGPVYTVEEAFADPQAVHRGTRVTVEHPLSGPTALIANPIKFSATPIERYDPPPAAGEHSNEILREFLGLSDERIASLRAQGAI
jgi:crotonobetainyl-CoA:carnitine CoA-transferase CaiB-like acyl-CoA transferase